MKSAHYSDRGVVAGYERWRFGGRGGAWVNQRELTAVLTLLGPLPAGTTVLDLPVGTGRVAERLLALPEVRVVAADISGEMLTAARHRCGRRLPALRSDGHRLGIAPNSCDAVVALRYLFHFARPDPLLAEFQRVLRPGGRLVCDTLRWSPRAAPTLLQRRLGGRVWPIADHRAVALFANNGFRVVGREQMFLLPSQLLRFTPGPLLGLLARLERRVPTRLLSKSFWALQRES